MATLTIDVPDEVAQSVAQLPDASRAAYLARMNAFAVATLTDSETEQEATYYLLDDLEGESSTEADAVAVKEALDAYDAGDRGRSASASYAKLAAKYGFKNATL